MTATTPPVALRTYTALRGGVVAVIGALGFAVWREIANSPDSCFQRSLSAYYYTPVRPIFVGALLVIGFAMITMWGKTPWEDAALNLAGVLLMGVALVPTLDANYCSIPADLRGTTPDDATQRIKETAIIMENAETVSRSFSALLAVLAVTLGIVFVTSVVMWVRATPARKPTTRALIAYVATWLSAVAACAIYYYYFRQADDVDSAFNHDLHGVSANIAVGLAILAACFAAFDKRRSPEPSARKWMWLYGVNAGVMVLSAIVIKGGDKVDLFNRSPWMDSHATFVVEAVLIALIGAFWVIQTIDRRNDGAPAFEPPTIQPPTVQVAPSTQTDDAAPSEPIGTGS